MKSYIVKYSDLVDPKKNPGFELSAESIIKNKKIPKIPYEEFMIEKGKKEKLQNEHKKSRKRSL